MFYRLLQKIKATLPVKNEKISQGLPSCSWSLTSSPLNFIGKLKSRTVLCPVHDVNFLIKFRGPLIKHVVSFCFRSNKSSSEESKWQRKQHKKEEAKSEAKAKAKVKSLKTNTSRKKVKRATHTQSTHETHAHEEGRQKGKEANDQNNKPTRRKGKKQEPTKNNRPKAEGGKPPKTKPKRRETKTTNKPTTHHNKPTRRKKKKYTSKAPTETTDQQQKEGGAEARSANN